jgi:hypothetical protein
MKAIDIATRNHVSTEDVQEICRELGIPFELEKDLKDQDTFLIEKKIEVIKIKKAQKAEEAKKGKKIKLKRKVHVPKESRETPGAETPPAVTREPEPSEPEKAAAAGIAAVSEQKEVQEPRRPAEGTRPVQRQGVVRPQGRTWRRQASVQTRRGPSAGAGQAAAGKTRRGRPQGQGRP